MLKCSTPKIQHFGSPWLLMSLVTRVTLPIVTWQWWRRNDDCECILHMSIHQSEIMSHWLGLRHDSCMLCDFCLTLLHTKHKCQTKAGNVDIISVLLLRNNRRWYVLMITKYEHWTMIRRMNYEVEGTKPTDRPTITWREIVEAYFWPLLRPMVLV